MFQVRWIYFFLMNQILKSYLVIITLEKSLGSPTKGEMLPSLAKSEPAYSLCNVRLDHGSTGRAPDVVADTHRGQLTQSGETVAPNGARRTSEGLQGKQIRVPHPVLRQPAPPKILFLPPSLTPQCKFQFLNITWFT